MTLVRIDVIEGRRSPVQLEILADTVHSTIVEVFGAAVTERYQIITEHRPGRIITFNSGLGEGRADDVVIIQIVQSGRTAAQKQVLYRELTERLCDRLALRDDDLIVTIIENTHNDSAPTATWSTGRATPVVKHRTFAKIAPHAGSIVMRTPSYRARRSSAARATAPRHSGRIRW